MAEQGCTELIGRFAALHHRCSGLVRKYEREHRMKQSGTQQYRVMTKPLIHVYKSRGSTILIADKSMAL